MVVRRRLRAPAPREETSHLAVSSVCAGPAVEAPPEQRMD
jgi:hypothetical protein